MKVTAGVGIFGNKLRWLHRSCAPKLYQRERQPRKTENELTSGLKPNLTTILTLTLTLSLTLSLTQSLTLKKETKERNLCSVYTRHIYLR